MTDVLSGRFLIAWARASLAGLYRHRSEINQLNVFPIPDSDTGTNMAATMKCAVDRLDTLDTLNTEDAPTAADVAAALAAGAVSGARGNSGMVLSQIFRAIADTASMSATGNLSARAVPLMLSRAEGLVTAALSNPVEGTIVTVLRDAAAGAQSEVDTDPGAALEVVVTAALNGALAALERTTDQLDALTDAGVVDAGGRGLVVILQALVDALRGDVAADPIAPIEHRRGSDERGDNHEDARVAHLELVFGFRGDVDRLRDALEKQGDSVVIVTDADGYRAHVHTTVAGKLLERVFSLGVVHDLHIEVLPEPLLPQGRPSSLPVIALLPFQSGGSQNNSGLAELFTSAGAAVGDSPTSLTEALAAVNGPSIVLTNGQRTADLFAVLEHQGLEVTVVDTASFVGGLAALAVYSPDADIEDNAEDMADAVHGQRWRNVVGGELAPTETVGTDDGVDSVDTVVSVVTELLDDGGELVTVLYGDALTRENMLTLSAAVSSSHPNADIHGVHISGLELIAQVGVE